MWVAYEVVDLDRGDVLMLRGDGRLGDLDRVFHADDGRDVDEEQPPEPEARLVLFDQCPAEDDDWKEQRDVSGVREMVVDQE